MSRRCEGGSQPRLIEKMYLRIIASQKTGNDTPVSATTTTNVSVKLPRLSAAKTPAGIPTRSANSIATRVSSRVAGKRRASVVATGTRVNTERPKSPRRALPIKKKY